MPEFTWTPRNDARLLAMRRRQFTFTEIANRLGTTKDAAQGRADRLRKRRPSEPQRTYPKFVPHAQKGQAEPQKLNYRPGAQAARAEKILRLTPANVRPDTGADLWRPRTCQWIDGEPLAEDSCKCGEKTAAGESWCPGHLTRIYSRGKVS